MTRELTGLSSMATKKLLADLTAHLAETRDLAVRFESAGGVEVARRVREGASADVLVLADAAMRELDGEGLLSGATLRPLFRSEVVAAVPAGDAPPDLAAEDDLRRVLLGASRIAYSTGPSGTALLALLDRWGLGAALAERLVQAPPGVPVGSLLASHHADLGFQQHSELVGTDGVRVVGALPGEAAISSVFSGAVPAVSTSADLAAEALDWFASAEAEPIVRANAMAPAS